VNRRGGLTVNQMILLVLGVALLVIVVVTVIKPFGNFNFFFNLFDYRIAEAEVGDALIGVSLKDAGLYYYDGVKWRGIKEDAKEFRLNEFVFNPRKVRDKIADFYTGTERVPDKFVMDFNHWRYWEVLGLSSSLRVNHLRVNVKDNIKKGFDEYKEGLESYFYYLSVSDNLEPTFPKSESDFRYIDAKSILPFVEYSGQKSKVIEWRDSILESGKCEKFVELDFKINDKDDSGKYKVDKRSNDEGNYLIVNLDDEATGVEKYGSGCFEVENYFDVDRSDWENFASVELWFRDMKGWAKFWWFAEEGWSYQDSTGSYSLEEGNADKIRDSIPNYAKIRSVLPSASFEEGFKEIDDALFASKGLKMSVKNPSTGNWRVLYDENSLTFGTKEAYKFFEEYNLYYEPWPLEFDVYENVGILVFKSVGEDKVGKKSFIGIVVRNGEVGYLKGYQSEWDNKKVFDNIGKFVVLGSYDNQRIIKLDSLQGLNDGGLEHFLNMLRGSNMRSFMKDSDFYGGFSRGEDVSA
jgi:hypothetical protein